MTRWQSCLAQSGPEGHLLTYELITAVRAAELLGLTVPGIHFLIREGQLTAYRMEGSSSGKGARLFLLKTDVEKLAEIRAASQ